MKHDQFNQRVLFSQFVFMGKGDSSRRRYAGIPKKNIEKNIDIFRHGSYNRNIKTKIHTPS